MWKIRNSNRARFNCLIIFIFCLFATVPNTIAAGDEKFDRLLAAARATGAVRIIVGVKIADGFLPEGDLPDDEQAERQRGDYAFNPRQLFSPTN